MTNLLARAGKQQRLQLEVTSDTRWNSNTNSASRPSTEKEKILYAVEKLLTQEDRPTTAHQGTEWYNYENHDSTVGPEAHILHHFREVYCQKTMIYSTKS